MARTNIGTWTLVSRTKKLLKKICDVLLEMRPRIWGGGGLYGLTAQNTQYIFINSYLFLSLMMQVLSWRVNKGHCE